MTTQYYTATSIDGFIADPDNSLEWLFQFSEAPGMEEQYPRFIAEVGAIAMGSTTYEWIARHTGFLDDPSKWEYPMPSWVFSSRELPRVDGPDIRFVSGDVAAVHAEMVEAAGDKNVWLVGGGDLVGQFHDHGTAGRGDRDDRLGVPRRRGAAAAAPDHHPTAGADRSPGVRHRFRQPALPGRHLPRCLRQHVTGLQQRLEVGQHGRPA